MGDSDKKMKATVAFEQGSEGVGSNMVLCFFFKDYSDKQVENKLEWGSSWLGRAGRGASGRAWPHAQGRLGGGGEILKVEVLGLYL